MSAGSEQKTDFVIIGATVAGLRAAVDLAEAGRVLLLGKGDPEKSRRHHAEALSALPPSDEDRVALHFHDTLNAGDGLCREDAVHILFEEGAARIQELIEWGNRAGHATKLVFGAEATHGRPCLLRAEGVSTAGEVLRLLEERARPLHNLHVQSHAYPVDLIVEDGRVCGVMYLDEKTSAFRRVRAKAVLLATGGLGQVYRETTNLPAASGDGVAMAWRAGALLRNLEFVEFHPTTLHVKGAPPIPLPESLRSEGAYLRNVDLERFMPQHHEAGELAPRDILSRAIALEMQKCHSSFVYLDLTRFNAEKLQKRFPRVYETCLRYNVDISTDLIPVQPAANFSVGGAATDLNGATTLPGLYAAGETASTGVHGANYLPGNSLLEELVFAARAARALVEGRASGLEPQKKLRENKGTRSGPQKGPGQPGPESSGEAMLSTLRSLMWEKVGVIRRGKQLREAVRWLESASFAECRHHSRDHYEQRDLLDVARLITRSALAREESRGVHYRADFPLRDDAHPLRQSLIRRDEPVSFS
jgi:L-aspartate oxidase